MLTFKSKPGIQSNRTGAVLPFFAFILPVLLIFCGFAINLAYMQMVSTDIKIATDASAHAGGRAMSLLQSTDGAINKAREIGQLNTVGGRALTVGVQGGSDEIQVGFGVSQRANNGYGMYQFTAVPKAQVDNRTQRANSVSVTTQANLPLVFQAMNFGSFGGSKTNFDIGRRSIATQVDRDIALVLDRSGSMLEYMDEAALTSTINTLYNTYDSVDQGFWRYRTRRYNSTTRRWVDNSYRTQTEINNNPSWQVDWADKQWTANWVNVRRISQTERDNANLWLYDRFYTNNIIYQIERHLNPGHTLGTSYTQSKQSQLTAPMAIYVSDWTHFYQTNESRSPRYSRWYFLDLGVNAFLNVIDQTDQIEHVSLTTFASSSSVDLQIQTTYNSIRTSVSGRVPYGGTGTGTGMTTSVPTITTAANARPFAAKTMVVLTDGMANSGIGPAAAAQQIRNTNNITIHTVTFTVGAEIGQMQQAAQIGGGKHYHTNDGAELVDIFEEIANNLPTILTE